MEPVDFLTWTAQQESTAFKRKRHDAALGLKPEIPQASIHSHSTATPFEVDALTKDKKPAKKRKSKKKED